MHTASSSAAKQDVSQKAMLWIVFVGFFMQALDTTIVNTALPSMARSLGEKPLDLKSVVVAYTLTMALLNRRQACLQLAAAALVAPRLATAATAPERKPSGSFMRRFLFQVGRYFRPDHRLNWHFELQQLRHP